MNSESIKSILVPVDFTHTSRIALNEAIPLSKLMNAKIHLIHISETEKYAYFILPEDNRLMMIPENFEKAIENNMKYLSTEVEKKTGMAPATAIVSGYVYTEVISYAKENKIDLIVMGTHGASGLNELFLGSNAQRVVSHADIPVLTLQKNIPAKGFQNILIPIDNSLHSREKVNIAMEFAKLYHSKIHIVGLPETTDEDILNSVLIKLDSVVELVSEQGHVFEKAIIPGKNIAVGALKYAKESNCDLIVINTDHESEMPGAFLGAFAQQIVNHSRVPVLNFKHSESHYLIEIPGYGIS